MAARHKRPRPGRTDQRRPGNGDTNAVDEELLASYLAGTLTFDQREVVARYLTNNPEAREVLSMALEAMAAERRTH